MSRSAHPESFRSFQAAAVYRPAFRGRLGGTHRERARLSGCAKATGGSEIIPLKRGEELDHGPAPHADFRHGSPSEGSAGAQRFLGTGELSTRFLFRPSLICKHRTTVLAYKRGLGVILSTATSGPKKTSARTRAEKGALMTLIWGTRVTKYW